MTGYGSEYRKQHEAEMKAAEDEQKERDRQNAKARKAYLARLEAERDAKRAEHEAQIEQELAPTKERAKRQWLYDHPGRTTEDFDERAWPLLKANILEDQREQMIENEIEAQRRRMGSAI